MNLISDLIPKSGLKVFLLANEKHHGFANLRLEVLRHLWRLAYEAKAPAHHSWVD